MNNKDIEKKVNQVLKDDMLSWINEYCEWVEPLKVEVQLKSSKYLSITYMRKWLPPGNTTFEPFTYLGVTIEMETGSRVKLLDIFDENKLKEKIQNYKWPGYENEENYYSEGEMNEIIEKSSLTNKEYLDFLFNEENIRDEIIKSYLSRKDSFYLTKNKIIIVKNEIDMPPESRDFILEYKTEDFINNPKF